MRKQPLLPTETNGAIPGSREVTPPTHRIHRPAEHGGNIREYIGKKEIFETE